MKYSCTYVLFGYGTVVYLVSDNFFLKILQYWRNKCPRSYASYYEL